MSVAVPAYAVTVGGDWMLMGRFLVPGLAFQTLLLAWLLDRVRRWSSLATALATFAIVAVALLPMRKWILVPESLRVTYRFTLNGVVLKDPGFPSPVEELQRYRERAAYEKEVGKALAEYARPGDSIVAGAVGALGYYSNLHIYDRIGLVSREVAESVHGEARSGGQGSPRHDPGFSPVDEKGQVPPGFFLDERPTYLFFDVIDGPTMHTSVLAQAEKWRQQGSHWERYVPDFVPLDDREVSGTKRVLIVFRTIDDAGGGDVDPSAPPERAEAAWRAFYRRAAELPDERPVQ
jgi:hypothetical protein